MKLTSILSRMCMEDYKGSHLAPSEDGFSEPMHDINDMFPDIYSSNALRYYGNYGPDAATVIRIIKSAHKKPNALIKIYRAVPNTNNINKINNGDWVTISKSYAEQHGESHLDDDYKVLSKTVKAHQLYTNGDSVFEWGVVI